MSKQSPVQIGLDTNILVYLLDSDSPYHSLTTKVVHHLEANNVVFVLAEQTIIELIQVLTKFGHQTLSNSSKIVQNLLNHYHYDLIRPGSNTLHWYLELCETQTKNSKNHFDYYLAATLLDNDITQFLTNNPKDFDDISGLNLIPLSP